VTSGESERATGPAFEFNPILLEELKHVKTKKQPVRSQSAVANRLRLPGALKVWHAKLTRFPAEARNRSSRLWRGSLWEAAAWEAMALESFACASFVSAEHGANRARKILNSERATRRAFGGER
jgi:hypothetical protein